MRGFLTVLVLTISVTAKSAELTVNVINTKAEQGKIYVSLCQERNFMRKRCDYEIVRAAQEKFTPISFTALNSGTYAVSAFYDINDNAKLDSSLFGIPKEPTAVSNNAVNKKGAPKFDAAKFELKHDETKRIDIELF